MPHAEAIAREDVSDAPEVDVRTLLGGGDGPMVARPAPPQ
jgi:hypothetical protein